MSEHTYKHITLTGSSPENLETAVNNALKRASASVRNMRWFEVEDIRGHIDEDHVQHWQVTIKVGFTLEE